MGQTQSQSILRRYVKKYLGNKVAHPPSESFGNKIAYQSSTPKSAKLADFAAPVCASLIEELGYLGTPRPSDEDIEAVLKIMLKKARTIGVSLDDPLSAKGFWLGHSLGLVSSHLIIISSRVWADKDDVVIAPAPRPSSRGPSVHRLHDMAHGAVR